MDPVDCVEETEKASDQLSSFRRSRPKPIPPPLVLHSDRLTEFAIIATSPRSPLMQKNLPIRKRALSCSSVEAVQSPVPIQSSSSSSSPNNTEDCEPKHLPISPYPASPFNTYGIGSLQVNSPQNGRGGEWGSNSPVPVWHCFLQGTKVNFSKNNSPVWISAEEVGMQERLRRQTEPLYAPNGLQMIGKFGGVPETSVRLRFRPVRDTSNPKPQSDLEVECSADHPFYAKEKGWSSVQPQSTLERYGIRCLSLEINDICVPPAIFESIRSFDFTPEDTSAVFALSSMAKHKQNVTQLISGVFQSPPVSPVKKCSPDNTKPKRPMNGFMLFAKQHRVEYTHSFPGKDNRAISVLLGDSWKRMTIDQRNIYAQQAKILAEETKKVFPDCWKRRRSLTTS